jgi:hypothetical protein
MADFCLTLTVSEGIGGVARFLPVVPYYTIACETDGVDPVSCARNYPEGFSIPIAINPTSGWHFHKWEIKDGNGNLIHSGDDSGVVLSLAGFFKMPGQDCTLTIFFSPGTLNVILQSKVNGLVTDNGGCILISSSIPSDIGSSLPCSGGNISVSYGSLIEITTSPKSGYDIQSRTVNGVSQSGVDSFNLEIYTDTTVIVNYQLITVTDCDTYHLTVTVEGSGSVSPSSGDYCDGETISLIPIPSGGSKFVRWEYIVSDLDISLNNITLNVTMNSDKSVKAIFESNPFVETFSPNVFYCPSEEYKSHLVPCEYTNETNSDGIFHFRSNFYHDADRSDLFYSAFSFLSTKRWYYYDGLVIREIPQAGLFIRNHGTYQIFYDPEVMPQNLSEEQREYTTNHSNNETELPLVCGNQYYISIERYDVTNDIITLIKNITLIADCDMADGFYWSDDKDKNRWLASGQGKEDLKVSDSSNYSVSSAISAGKFDQFGIVWQGNRKTSNAIYGAIWDSKKDVLYSSGQGLFDKKYISNGVKPMILSDPASNFYITSNTKTDIGVNVCPPVVAVEFPGQETEDLVFEALCRPGENVYLGVSVGDLAIRVRQEDIDGSLIVNKDKALAIISKQDITLDISGIEGAYAVRLRNSEDSEWGEWLLIDSDENNNIVKIDNQRFLVPWSLGRTNGVRRICCRILTLYGVTKTFCLEVFLNKSPIDYTFKFYKDVNREIPADLYNGMPVLTGVELGTLVYFSVIFSEEIYKNKTTNPPIPYADGDLTFNIIQQGINEIWSQSLIKINNMRFDGSFNIYKSDGVFNKDGKAFIQIIFPDSLINQSCSSDKTDIYNLMVNSAEAVKYQNLSPEEVYSEATSDTIHNIESINSFKQYYDKDDENFLFGNPNYFRDN